MSTKHRPLLNGAALAVLSMTCARPAFAQDAPPGAAAVASDAETGTPAEPASAEPAAPDNQGVGDIVVTATRRETNLQRTPLAISVVSTQALQDRHVQSLYDFADGAVPS